MIKELIEKEAELIKKASKKEVIFYKFLIGSPEKHPEDTNIPEILDICYGAFTTPTKLDKDKARSYTQNTKPVMGMHYSNNIIELAALARHNFDCVHAELDKYISTHSTRDSYILHQIFPSIEIKANNSTNIDRLVDEILVKKNRNYPVINLLSTISDSKDLLDLVILNKTWAELIDSKIVYLLKWHIAITRFIEVSTSFSFNLLVVALILGYLWLISLTYQKFNTAIGYVLMFVEIGLPVVMIGYRIISKKALNIISIIEKLKSNISTICLTKIYSLLKYDYRIIRRLIIDYSK